MNNEFYSQTLSEHLMYEGYKFGDTRIIVQQPAPTMIGFIPIPGLVICGEELYIKTTALFESCNRQRARIISSHLRAILETHPNNIHFENIKNKMG